MQDSGLAYAGQAVVTQATLSRNRSETLCQCTFRCSKLMHARSRMIEWSCLVMPDNLAGA